MRDIEVQEYIEHARICDACKSGRPTAECESCSAHGFHLGQPVVVHRTGGMVETEGWYVSMVPSGITYAYTAPEVLLVEVMGLRGVATDPWSWITKKVPLNELREWQAEKAADAAPEPPTAHATAETGAGTP